MNFWLCGRLTPLAPVFFKGQLYLYSLVAFTIFYDLFSLNVMHLGDLGGGLRERDGSWNYLTGCSSSFSDLWFGILHYIWKIHGYCLVFLLSHFSSFWDSSGHMLQLHIFPKLLDVLFQQFSSFSSLSFSLGNFFWPILKFIHSFLSCVVLIYQWAHQRHSSSVTVFFISRISIWNFSWCPSSLLKFSCVEPCSPLFPLDLYIWVWFYKLLFLLIVHFFPCSLYAYNFWLKAELHDVWNCKLVLMIFVPGNRYAFSSASLYGGALSKSNHELIRFVLFTSFGLLLSWPSVYH